MIYVVIVLVLIMLLISVFVYKRYEFNGGDYIPLMNDVTNELVHPSISQILITRNDINGIINNVLLGNVLWYNAVDYIINESALFYKEHGTCQFMNQNHIIVPAHKGKTRSIYNDKHISDANIDLLNLILSKDITIGYCGCEWFGNSKRLESNQFYTLYNCHANGNYKILNTTNNDETHKISILQSKDYIPLIQPVINKPNVHIYLEFVYKSDKGGIYPINKNKFNMYTNVHKNTSEILHRIIDVNKQPTIEYMFIYRVYVNNDGIIENIPAIETIFKQPYNIGLNNQLLLFIYDEFSNEISKSNDFDTINVPENKTEFKYDEYLIFKDFDENVHDVQIEHSENYDEHKSNIVEFVVRNLVDKDMDMSNVILTILTKLLSYKINKATGKLIYKLETSEKQVPMSKRTLYKSFGKYKTLIEDEMIAETKVDNS